MADHLAYVRNGTNEGVGLHPEWSQGRWLSMNIERKNSSLTGNCEMNGKCCLEGWLLSMYEEAGGGFT